MKTQETTANSHSERAGSRALVVYFSCSGTTKNIAEQIAKLTDATVWRIVPQQPYTAEDLDYNNESSRSSREHRSPSSRPAISGKPENLNDYDTVFLGYPIWWGEAPNIVFTFLESDDFSGKTIIPFCTSHSSPLGASDTNLHRFAPQAIWKKGRCFTIRETQPNLEKWLTSLNWKRSNERTSGSPDFGKK